MPSNDEIKRVLNELEQDKIPIQGFRDKWRRLLYPLLLEMVTVPAGSFQMGSESHYYWEKPVHTVSLSAFQMANYPVVFRQWQEVKEWAEKNDYSFMNQGQPGAGSKANENHPVTCVSWYDAVLWCNALSEREGRVPCYYKNLSKKEIYRNGKNNLQNDSVNWVANGYRLPTEAEWEYACRAGTSTEYSFGNKIGKKQANYSGNEGGTTPAGKYPGNQWGLQDMHGNVWEWCWDWWDRQYYEQSPEANPIGPEKGLDRVLRGGSWHFMFSNLRSANRNSTDPENAYDTYGFRPICKAKEKEKE